MHRRLKSPQTDVKQECDCGEDAEVTSFWSSLTVGLTGGGAGSEKAGDAAAHRGRPGAQPSWLAGRPDRHLGGPRLAPYPPRQGNGLSAPRTMTFQLSTVPSMSWLQRHCVVP